MKMSVGNITNELQERKEKMATPVENTKKFRCAIWRSLTRLFLAERRSAEALAFPRSVANQSLISSFP
jgi:hypothetical protein